MCAWHFPIDDYDCAGGCIHLHRERVFTRQIFEVNGVRYDRLDDVPPEYRTFFVDEDGNGVPDAADALVRDGGGSARSSEMRIASTTAGMSDLVRKQLLQNASRAAKIRCTVCDYDLAGTPVGGNCPECGTEVAASIMNLVEPSRWNGLPGSGSMPQPDSRHCHRRIRAVGICNPAPGFIQLRNVAVLK